MQKIDPKSFGGACVNRGIFIGQWTWQSACDDLLANVVPGFVATATNQPSGTQGAVFNFDHGSIKKGETMDVLSKESNPMATGTAKPIVFAIMGEHHEDWDDAKRVGGVVNKLQSQKSPEHTLILFERGLKRKHVSLLTNQQVIVVEEDELYRTADSGGIILRNTVIASYVFACLASGDQGKKDRVVIPIGDEHVANLVLAFERLMTNGSIAPWLASRPRAYHTLRTTS